MSKTPQFTPTTLRGKALLGYVLGLIQDQERFKATAGSSPGIRPIGAGSSSATRCSATSPATTTA